MRKSTFFVPLLVCVVLLVAPAAKAESATETRMYLDAGAITDDHFKHLWWQAGAMLDLPLGGSLFVTPEVLLIGPDFKFDEFYLYPGATINLKTGDQDDGFFFGGGAMLYFRLKPKGGGTELLPKVQIGYFYEDFKFTLYFYTFTKGSFLKYNYLGLQIGIGL